MLIPQGILSAAAALKVLVNYLVIAGGGSGGGSSGIGGGGGAGGYRSSVTGENSGGWAIATIGLSRANAKHSNFIVRKKTITNPLALHALRCRQPPSCQTAQRLWLLKQAA